MIRCEYCGTVNNIEGMTTLLCLQCGGPLKYSPQPTVVQRTVAAVQQVVSGTSWPIIGIDVSEYQGIVDWGKATAQGIGFAYIRGGQGNSYVDAQFERNRRECATRGIPFGVYHVSKPSKDWRKQAEFMADLCEGAPLYGAHDAELHDNLDKQTLTGWMTKYVARATELLEYFALIYTNSAFWDGRMSRTDWAKTHPLWVANYTTKLVPIIPADWGAIHNPKPWSVWQWSAGGNGKGVQYGAQSVSIDLNRFNGDADAFQQLFGIAPLVGSVPPEDDDSTLPSKVRTTVNLNIRPVPTTANNKPLIVAPLGTDLVVHEKSEDGNWYRVTYPITGWVSKSYCSPVDEGV